MQLPSVTSFQNLCIKKEELQCLRSFNAGTSGCLKKCEGMNVVTYSVQELEPKWSKHFTKSRYLTDTRFLNDPKQTRFISKLSDKYNKFKRSYNFPAKFKSK